MSPRTHQAIATDLSGAPTALGDGEAVVSLDTSEVMRADEHGLVHGGFVFSLADHAAMLAIDEPTVVLGSAEVRFTAPVTVGEHLVAVATRTAVEGKKHRVEVTVHRGARDGEPVFTGTFTCFVPPKHVLS